MQGNVGGTGGSTGSRKDRPSAAPSGQHEANRARPRHRSRSRNRSVSRVAAQPRPWNSLLASDPHKSTPIDLSFVEPVIHGETKIAIYDSDTSKEIVDAWPFAVMGYCVGLKPSYTVLLQFIQRAWNCKGSVDLFMREGGFFVCVFNLEEDLHKVLEGYWALRGHPLVLRRWSPDLDMEKERLTSIPVWVRFPSLPLAWWSARGLSQISSIIGHPLRMDQLTASRKRLQYARVCILVEVGSELPKSVSIISSKGTPENISVQYDWIPKVCKTCNLFGHETSDCRRNNEAVAPPVLKTRPSSTTGDQSHLPLRQPTAESARMQQSSNSADDAATGVAAAAEPPSDVPHASSSILAPPQAVVVSEATRTHAVDGGDPSEPPLRSKSASLPSATHHAALESAAGSTTAGSKIPAVRSLAMKKAAGGKHAASQKRMPGGRKPVSDLAGHTVQSAVMHVAGPATVTPDLESFAVGPKPPKKSVGGPLALPCFDAQEVDSAGFSAAHSPSATFAASTPSTLASSAGGPASTTNPGDNLCAHSSFSAHLSAPQTSTSNNSAPKSSSTAAAIFEENNNRVPPISMRGSTCATLGGLSAPDNACAIIHADYNHSAALGVPTNYAMGKGVCQRLNEPTAPSIDGEVVQRMAEDASVCLSPEVPGGMRLNSFQDQLRQVESKVKKSTHF